MQDAAQSIVCLSTSQRPRKEAMCAMDGTFRLLGAKADLVFHVTTNYVVIGQAKDYY